ncbi:hypothetical protein OPV22_001774 [Ensete ventricosum]|uniref:Fe2OG dioxygenase domain-containing protein n=1 Tax=Ensete ventricosum TaxID=4639 RepID=A0AAV8QEP1_ENSVE|nr:hypothetical protein OPV22_001774 [Ensete ventricosum]
MAAAQEMVGLARITRPVLQVAAEPVSLPVIDLGQLRKHSRTRSLAIQEIGRACERHGCFQVINHGIHESVTWGALEAASDFFNLSSEEKAEFESKDLRKPVRYEAVYKNDCHKARELLKHYAHPLGEWIHFWPMTPQRYRERMGRYGRVVRKIALLLMDSILESLGLGPAYLKEKLEEGMQVMVMNGYSERSRSAPVLGLAPHSDYGCITILLQSCKGLHIFDEESECWREVPEVPDTLHVHIGDHLEVMSNGKYKRLVHRAVLNSRTRTSIASIHGLSMNEKVTTAEELVDEQHPKGYRDSSFLDFLDFITSKNKTGGSNFIDSLMLTGN